jgi:predicted adenylyl cyclase CyaB
MSAYEIEIKSLLGTPERARELRGRMYEIDPQTVHRSSHKQLNHYFVDGDVEKLYELLVPRLSPDEREKLQHIIDRGSDFSIRTRLADETLLLVIKASIDEGSSHNTISRLEFEAEISGMTLEELDELVQKAEFKYQAKWSREREEYVCRDINVCLDKNAGYGYLAEFEKVLDSEEGVDTARRELKAFMEELSVKELPQDRLERMFAYYNQNWPEYYGTEKIFTVE